MNEAQIQNPDARKSALEHRRMRAMADWDDNVMTALRVYEIAHLRRWDEKAALTRYFNDVSTHAAVKAIAMGIAEYDGRRNVEAAWLTVRNWVNYEPEGGWGSMSLSDAILYALKEEESAKIAALKANERDPN